MSPTFLFFALLSCSVVLPSEGGLAPNKAGIELLVRGLDVVEFTPEIFEDRVLLRAGVRDGAPHHTPSWVVLFCKAENADCAQLVPSFRQLYLRMAGPSGDVRFGTFDCAPGSNEALCADLAVKEYPTIAHYQDGKNVGTWTSDEKVGLVPWLHKEMHGDHDTFRASQQQNTENAPLFRSTPKRTTQSASGKPVSMADYGDHSLTAPFHGVSHLKYLQEYILMEDCLFTRMFNGVLVALVLGWSIWILVSGAELWPVSVHASSSYSDASVLY